MFPKQKGQTELFIILIITLLAIVLAGGLSLFPTEPVTPAFHPLAPPCPTDIQKAIQEKFHLVVYDSDPKKTQSCWLWKKLWDISNTKFNALLPTNYPIYIGKDRDGNNIGVSVTSNDGYTNLRNQDNELNFDIIAFHELSHAIDKNNPTSKSHRSDLNSIWDKEGGITEYGNIGSSPPCGGDAYSKDNATGEDYAEMLTYYLNPKGTESTDCPPSLRLHPGENPYDHNRYPLHKQLAKTILGAY